MFSLRTARGWAAVLSVLAMLVTMGACADVIEPGTEVDPADSVEVEPDPEDQDRPTAPPSQAAGETMVVGVDARTCHDRNVAGGNSDVVFRFDLDSMDDWQDGTTGSATYTSTNPDSGGGGEVAIMVENSAAIALVPAYAPGDVVTITEVTLSGTTMGFFAPDASLQHTVPPVGAGDCSTHPLGPAE